MKEKKQKAYMKSKDWEVYKILKRSMEWGCSWMELYEIQKALFQQKMVNIRNFHLSDSFEDNLINLCEFRHKKNP